MTRITDDNIATFLDEKPDDVWCGKTRLGKRNFRWTEKIAASDLDARVAAEYPEVGRVKALVPGKRGVSGRIESLAIKGDKTSVDVTGDVHIRRLLGGLKSTLFEVHRDGASFVFHGAGFGHGVGMCQAGAIGMAEAGKSNGDILKHYFRGTHLHRLY